MGERSIYAGEKMTRTSIEQTNSLHSTPGLLCRPISFEDYGRVEVAGQQPPALRTEDVGEHRAALAWVRPVIHP